MVQIFSILKRLSILFSLLILAFTQHALAINYEPAISGHSNKEIQPSDVFARAIWLEKELDLIDQQNFLFTDDIKPIYSVKNVEPREVYFMASAVLEKIQRLSFEQTRSLGSKRPNFLKFRERPFNVFQVLNRALDSVKHIKKATKVTQSFKEQQYFNKTPSDVYNQLLIVSRKLSILLSHKIQPKNVFQQIQKSYYYATQFYLNVHTKPFDENSLSNTRYKDKKPQHVFHNLIDIFKDIQIYSKQHFNINILTEISVNDERPVQPSDVYDLSNLVLAEFKYLAYKQGLKALKHKAINIPLKNISTNDVFKKTIDLKFILNQQT